MSLVRGAAQATSTATRHGVAAPGAGAVVTHSWARCWAHLGFTRIAAAKANFSAHQKGSKPIFPLPPDFVLTYEMLSLDRVYITVFGFLISAGLPAGMGGELYNVTISEDQIGVMVRGRSHEIDETRWIFERQKLLSIQDEAA